MDLRVVSFQKLSKEVLEFTGGANRSYIDNIGKAILNNFRKISLKSLSYISFGEHKDIVGFVTKNGDLVD